MKSFAERILEWFDENGRKSLPWQRDITPYRVWISEIMLQQTQVATVIPYYNNFMERFPSVEELALAPLDDVLNLWTGLGYYARARNLHNAAKIIMKEHHGRFPTCFEQVTALPGIGRSTASAILAIADKQYLPILDGNVKRVLARYFAVDGWPGKLAVSNHLWKLAEDVMTDTRPDHYTQAMMDLGATVCLRSKPKCEQCPVVDSCLAYVQGRQSELPAKKPQKVIPEKNTIMMIPVLNGRVLMYKRPPSGIWGGLWSFYQFDSKHELEEWVKTSGFETGQRKELSKFRHTFSHFHLDIQPQLLFLSEIPQHRVQEISERWFDVHQPLAVGVSAPTEKLIKQVVNEL